MASPTGPPVSERHVGWALVGALVVAAAVIAVALLVASTRSATAALSQAGPAGVSRAHAEG